MGGELIKEYVGIAMKGCHESASRHPLLAFTIVVVIWIYRSFPTLFAFLIDACPVIASTTLLLGTLLFLGQLHAPEIQKEEKSYHHKVHNLKFGIVGDTESDWRGAKPRRRQKASRKNTSIVHRVDINDSHHTEVETDNQGSSIDEKFIQEEQSEVENQKEKTILVDRSTQFPPLEAEHGAHRNDDDDDKGWETGSELEKSTSPTASMATGFIPMVDELHHLHNDPEVIPQHAHVSNLSTDTESSNSEENDHRNDIKVKNNEKKGEDQKNHFDRSFDSNENVIESAPIISSTRQESDTVDSSVPLKPNNELSDQHESFDVEPSTLMASKQGKQGYNLGPQSVTEPETSDASNNSSMHREMDGVSDSDKSSIPVTESVGFPLNREVNSTSIKEGFDAESVVSSHYEDDLSHEADLTPVKEDHFGEDSTSLKKGIYKESVNSSLYEEDPSKEADLTPVKEGNYGEDSTSMKKGIDTKSISSSHYEEEPSKEADLTPVKEGNYEEDSTSMKKGIHTESVASSHYEEEPSKEDDLTPVKEGNYGEDSTSMKKGIHTESVASSHYEENPSKEADLTPVKEGNYGEDSTSTKKGIHTESVVSSHYEEEPSQEADLTPVKESDYGEDSTSMKKVIDTESVNSSHSEDDRSQEADLVSVKEGYDEDDSTSMKSGFYPESVASSRYEDYPSQEVDLSSINDDFDSQSVSSDHDEDDRSQADMMSVKDGYDEDDYSSVKGGNYAESVASIYTEDDPSREDDTNSVKQGYCASEISDYVSQRSGSSDDDDIVEGRPDEVKTYGGDEKEYPGKSVSESGSSPHSDITDHIDDEEDDYGSAIMPLNSHAKDQKIQEEGKEILPNINSATTAEVVDSNVHDSKSNATDSDDNKDDQSPKSEHNDNSTVKKPNEGRIPRRLSKVPRGLTSWFKWKP